MDSGTITVTIVFIAIVTLPFILSGISKKRKKKKLLQHINELAVHKNCYITQYDFGFNFVVGLDNMADYLFFYKRNENRESQHAIHLKEIRNCKILNSSHEISEGKENFSAIKKLELCLYPIDKNNREEYIEFYNNEYDNLTLSGQLQMAEKWAKLINGKIKKSKTH
ncbi:MAG: hypothetical protein PHS40_00710 [Mariniphaga sp.]|nr:hypothetical protein [Mariniphaga sp.]